MSKLVKKKILKENVCDPIEYRARSSQKRNIYPTTVEMHAFQRRSRVSKPTSLPSFLCNRLRKGEALALTWDDIDFVNKRVRVNKEYETRTKVIDDPKTPAAIRSVPLFDEAEEALKEIKSRNGDIFSFISKSNITHLFPRIASEYGIKLPSHNLRHYFSTQCLERNVDSKTASMWMGHASFDLRINTYSHISKDFESEQIRKLANKTHMTNFDTHFDTHFRGKVIKIIQDE
ncbi:MAG: site-specific integrase [Bacillus subtilis]|nr:site-specific integrase [Bacillus subtilis]